MEPSTAFLLTALTGLIGYLIGNWLTIGRDKRKERIEAVKPVRTKLLNALHSTTPYSAYPTIEELDLLRSYFGKRKRKNFMAALKSYGDICQLYEHRTKTGAVEYTHTKEIEQAIEHLLDNFLKIH